MLSFGALSTLFLASTLTATGAAPSSQEQIGATSAGYDAERAFATVLVTHLNRTLGTENLPAAMGQPIQPSMFVTLTMERVQLYDRNVASLQDGRVPDANVVATDCKSLCPAALYNPFAEGWLEAAIEARDHATEIAGSAVFGAHRNLPVATLVQAAYALAESRPVQPPNMALLVNGGKAGLRALPFYLLPPGGLQVSAGSAPLGLTVKVTPSGYEVSALSSRMNRRLTAATPADLAVLVKDIQKRFPSKQVIIYEFAPGATVERLVAAYVSVREEFPIAVLSAGQRVALSG